MLDNIQITVFRSDRKSVALRVTGPNTAEIRAPRQMPQAEIDAFLRKNTAWLEKHLALMTQRENEKEQRPKFTEQEVRRMAEEACHVIPGRVRYFAALIGVSYGRITIRNQKSKWGSCSGKGNLNFNCALTLCPPQALDYVVAHELCHRKEMNHSPAFWAEVERVMPDYRQWRDWLKNEGTRLIERF